MRIKYLKHVLKNRLKSKEMKQKKEFSRLFNLFGIILFV